MGGIPGLPPPPPPPQYESLFDMNTFSQERGVIFSVVLVDILKELAYSGHTFCCCLYFTDNGNDYCAAMVIPHKATLLTIDHVIEAQQYYNCIYLALLQSRDPRVKTGAHELDFSFLPLDTATSSISRRSLLSTF